jgi:preprotein translocase subunit SecG
MGPVFAIVLSLLAIFLILLVLVQRGRGGGLAGALGGMGGSSAFGAKAGDVFTRITIYTASIWIVFCLFALFWAKHRGDVLGSSPTTGSSPSSTSDSGIPPLQNPGPPRTGSELPEKAPPSTTTSPPASSPANSTTAPSGDTTNKEAPPGK